MPRNTFRPRSARVAIQSIFASPAAISTSAFSTGVESCDCPEKNTVHFSSVWDFVDDNMGAIGAGAVCLSTALLEGTPLIFSKT